MARHDLRELTRARVILFLREPEALFWVFFFPVIMAAVLGFAFRSGSVAPSRVGVLEGESSEALAAIVGSSADVQILRFSSREDALHRLARGRLDVLVEPATPPVVHYDPAREDAVIARLRVRDAWNPRGDGQSPVFVDRAVSGVGSRYIDYLFPGLLGMNLMSTGLWGIGFGLVDQRRKKLLRRMLVTPMRRSSFLLSSVLSRFVFLVMEVAVLLVFGILVLDVPLLGTVLAFAGICGLGALSFAGLGLLVAARPTTIEGISGILNLVMMPMWLCSGIFFSYERFPEALQPFCRALPLTALNDALRAVMLDGESLLSQATEIGILAAWGLVSFFLALRVFRWD